MDWQCAVAQPDRPREGAKERGIQLVADVLGVVARQRLVTAKVGSTTCRQRDIDDIWHILLSTNVRVIIDRYYYVGMRRHVIDRWEGGRGKVKARG